MTNHPGEPKVINLKDSVYTLCTRYPELMEVMSQLGFTDITKPGMLQTAGRFMTLQKGAALRRMNLEELIGKLRQAGFEVQQ